MEVEEREAEERNETNILEKEQIRKLPKRFFEGFVDQKKSTFFKILRVPVEVPPKPPKAVRVHRLHKFESDKYALRKVLFLQIEERGNLRTQFL